MKFPHLLRPHGWTMAFGSLACSFSLLGFLLSFQPSPTLAGGVVTNCTEAALRGAMSDGDLVTFACDGTITLASTIAIRVDTVLDATGHQITVSGGDAVRVFFVRSNVTFSLSDLMIAHGRSTNGAGIFSENATVNAMNITFYSNVVLGATGPSMAGGSVAGGGVANYGVLNLINCAFTFNSAAGGEGSSANGLGAAGFAGGSGVGGAIWNSGLLTATGCTFAANAASGGAGGRGGMGSWPPYPGGAGGSGGDGSGAALFNSGVARLVNCTWRSNTGSGGYGGSGGSGLPFPPYSGAGPNGTPGLGIGAIYNAGGHCYLTNCTAVSNSCMGANLARGGAIRNDNGEVCLSACVFKANGASGTMGSCWGGAVENSGTLWADLCEFIANSAVGGRGFYGGGSGYGSPGGNGGDGKGGAIYNSGAISILRTTFITNSALGGTGGSGGVGYYGDPGANGGSGGMGGSGGAGKGGAIYNAGTARVLGATLAFNFGLGADGGTGGDGGGSVYSHGGNGGAGGTGGGGIGAFFNSGDAQLINSTFAFNCSSSGEGGAGGSGGSAGGGLYPGYGGNGGNGGNGGSGFGAILDQGSCHLTNCTIALNSGSGEAGGPGGTGGHGGYGNGSPGASGSPGSSFGGITGGQMVNTLLRDNADMLLGPLANNGGPTLTMALLPGSPAIDAGNTAAAPFTDQRGFPRPAGSAADIGAFEYGSMLPVVSIARSGPSFLHILVRGNSNQWCRLQSSSNLADWISIITNQFSAYGTILFQDNSSPSSACRFYRAVMP